MTYLYIYLTAINAAAFVLMMTDKVKAMAGKRRISEKSLFLPMIAGGGLGGLLAMYIFNHKTRHKRFLIGVPLLTLLQIVAYVLYFIYFL